MPDREKKLQDQEKRDTTIDVHLHDQPLNSGLSTSRKCVAWNLPWPRFSPQAFTVLVAELVMMINWGDFYHS